MKTEGEALGFQPSPGTLRMLMNDKIMFDCINSTKHCENEEKLDTLYFITLSHFPREYAVHDSGRSHNLARALRDAW